MIKFGKPVPTDHALERSAAAKLELLHAVKLTLGEGHRIVEAQRTERRRPDETDTDRAANDVLLTILQSQAGPWVGRSECPRRPTWRGDPVIEAIDFVRQSPTRRSLVVPQVASVRIDRALQAHFLGQEPERHLQFDRCTPVLRTAKRVAGPERIDVARANAIRGKAANQVR